MAALARIQGAIFRRDGDNDPPLPSTTTTVGRNSSRRTGTGLPASVRSLARTSNTSSFSVKAAQKPAAQPTQSKNPSNGDDGQEAPDSTLDTLQSSPAPSKPAPAPTNPCPTPTEPCMENEASILFLSQDGTCRWVCQPDPQYRKVANAKKPIIGGSLGAVVLMLFALLVLLLATRYKRRKAERRAYLKDTADLADELSGVHLLESSQPQSSQSTELHPSGTNSLARSRRDLASLRVGTKLGLVFGAHSVNKALKTSSDPATRPLIPTFEEPGTELTMDIVDRPAEADTTLAVMDGSTPYRQEKTADAYPLLAQFSLLQHSVPVLFTGSANESAMSLSNSCAPGYLATTWTRTKHKNRQSKIPIASSPAFEPPEVLMMRRYEAVRNSGDAALAAAQESARIRQSEIHFNPFELAPSVRSSPNTEESQSLVSRKRSNGATSS
ncbi:hypothetical protein GGI12_001823 [Dipsacomyces acuminosporus]|nr:hypothetical protein GGI12_001823 [Dipsacomyces acuminosporus]